MGFHRTTITIPLDLKKEMDAVMSQVNWSEVAAEAFRAKVNKIKAEQAERDFKEREG